MCFFIDKGVTINFKVPDNKIIVVDHFIYGRPFFVEGTFDSTQSACVSDIYAQSTEEYCVSHTALAAVIYWCQGKLNCNFDSKILESASNFKDFFLLDYGYLQSFNDAASGCAKRGGKMAAPKSRNDVELLLKEAKRSTPEPKGFWIDPTVESVEDFYIHWPLGRSEPMAGQCLVVMTSPSEDMGMEHVLDFKWVECNDQYVGLCEKSFSQNVIDDLCLDDLETKIIEYRYHADDQLSSKSAKDHCAMEVNFILGECTKS